MNPTNKSLKSAGVLAGLIACTIGGLKFREYREMPETTQNSGLGGLLASKENQFSIAESDYYEGIIELLDARYVDKLPERSKLLSGAVRGMIIGLKDAESQFYNPQEFAAFKSIRAGIYTGVGVWLDYKPVKSNVKIDGAEGELMLPRLTVVSVGRGSAADKAGVKAGDLLEEVGDTWVMNTEAILNYRKAQADYMAKKIDFKKINDMRKSLKQKLDKSIMPTRAREKLVTGTEGTVRVVWERQGKLIETTLEKGSVPVKASEEAFALTFGSGAPDALRDALARGVTTIDLRNNILGDTETMRKCLALVAPSGTYGFFETKRKTAPVMLKLDSGNPKPPKLKLLVDQSTRDAAEIFAMALSSKGLATLSGGEMGGSFKSKEIAQLPDGSGYAMVTGTFRTGMPKATTTTAKPTPTKPNPKKGGVN
jgi:carboxyl-terminal processing protease